MLELFLSNEVYLCICDKNIKINITCDCKSFNMSYMKIESGGFGMSNTNCWCK